MSAPCQMLVLVEADRDGRLGAKEAASVGRHLQICAECQRFVADLDRLVELGKRSVDHEAPSPLEHRRRRLSLLRAAAGPQARAARRSVRLPLLAAVVAGVLAVVLWQLPSSPAVVVAQTTIAGAVEQVLQLEVAGPVGAIVQAAPRARFERLREGELERVRLRDGAIDVQVAPLPPGYRFLVATGDAEVEVRGTAFLVRAAADRLVEVVVREGRVEVRRGGSVTRLVAGQTWRVDQPLTARSEELAGAGPRAEGRVGHPPPAAPVGVSPAADELEAPTAVLDGAPAADGDGEQAAVPEEVPGSTPGAATREFAQAIALLEQKSYREAAKALREFGRRHGDDPQAEDADFLAIVALQRANRHAAAARAAAHYLVRHPKGARRAEAKAVARRGGASK